MARRIMHIDLDAFFSKRLLCGVGDRCRLFLADRAASLFKRDNPAWVVGLVDEDANLRKRRVYGYKVIGTPQEIRDVIRAHRVDRIVLTDVLSDTGRACVMQAAREAGVRVSAWHCEEREPAEAPVDNP